MKQFIFLLLTLFVLAGFSSELKALNHQSEYKYEQVVKATLDAEFVKSPMPYEFSRCQKQIFFDTHTSKAIIALSGRYCSIYQGQSVPNNVKAPLSRLINIKANE